MAPKNKKTQKSGRKTVAASQSRLLDLVGYNMKRAYMCVYQDFTDTLAGLDLRQRSFSVLAMVVENTELSQSDIARALGIERSGTVAIVDELEQKGLLQRLRVPDDRRAYALQATEAGCALFDRALELVREHEDRVLKNLDESEREFLSTVLKKIHNLNTEDT